MSDPSRLCSPCVQGLVSEMQSQGKEGRKSHAQCSRDYHTAHYKSNDDDEGGGNKMSVSLLLTWPFTAWPFLSTGEVT